MTNSVHLIHIGDQKEMRRAIEVFLEVPDSWMSFPGNVLGISGKHLEALQRAMPPVKYEPAKRAHLNGQKSPIRPK